MFLGMSLFPIFSFMQRGVIITWRGHQCFLRAESLKALSEEYLLYFSNEMKPLKDQHLKP